jgi:hypothetical protein
MKVYKPGVGDKLHLDHDCVGIQRGHAAADTNLYARHTVEEIEFDPFGEFISNPFCLTCLKNHTLSEERDAHGFGPRFLLDDTEISYNLFRLLREEWRP